MLVLTGVMFAIFVERVSMLTLASNGQILTYWCSLVTSDLIDERFCFGLLIDVGAQLDQALGQHGVSVLAGLLQHAVV